MNVLACASLALSLYLTPREITEALSVPCDKAHLFHLSLSPFPPPPLLQPPSQVPRSPRAQAGDSGLCWLSKTDPTPMRSPESRERRANRSHANTLGARGTPANEHDRCFWLLGNAQPQLMKCFLKGALLGNGLISSRKLSTRRSPCRSSSLAPNNTTAHCEHCIRLLKVKPWAMHCCWLHISACRLLSFLLLLLLLVFSSHSPPSSLALFPIMLQWATWGGDMHSPLPGDSLQGDVGSLPSQLANGGEGLGLPQRGTPPRETRPETFLHLI